MTSSEKAILKNKIEEQIAALQKQIETLKAKTEPIAPDCGLGRLTRLEAMGESQVNQQILEASLLRLTRLRNALSRLNHPMFGICIECEEEIGIERMGVRPESVRCVSCAERHPS